jgi:hypothetical protein
VVAATSVARRTTAEMPSSNAEDRWISSGKQCPHRDAYDREDDHGSDQQPAPAVAAGDPTRQRAVPGQGGVDLVAPRLEWTHRLGPVVIEHHALLSM